MNFSSDRPLVLIGAGKMGGAMLTGWMARGVDPAAVLVVDPGPPAEIREILARHTVRLVSVVPDGLKAGVLMIAVKPQMMDAVLDGLRSAVDGDTLVLSVAAGTPVARFERTFGKVAVTRVMPNTPAQVGRGMSVAFANDATSAEQRATVDELLAAIGASAWIEREEQMDAVTAVSGSGPAYVFYLVEAMAAAGARAGLDADLAMQLARQTVCGAGELLFQSELAAAELRRNVTSPKGTTEAALKVLMAEDGIQPVFDRAVAAARRRSEELAG